MPKNPPLPRTKAGSKIGLDFSCASCKTPIAIAAECFQIVCVAESPKLHVWCRSVVPGSVRIGSDPYLNAEKSIELGYDVISYHVFCATCKKHNIGNYFPEFVKPDFEGRNSVVEYKLTITDKKNRAHLTPLEKYPGAIRKLVKAPVKQEYDGRVVRMVEEVFNVEEPVAKAAASNNDLFEDRLKNVGLEMLRLKADKLSLSAKLVILEEEKAARTQEEKQMAQECESLRRELKMLRDRSSQQSAAESVELRKKIRLKEQELKDMRKRKEALEASSDLQKSNLEDEALVEIFNDMHVSDSVRKQMADHGLVSSEAILNMEPALLALYLEEDANVADELQRRLQEVIGPLGQSCRIKGDYATVHVAGRDIIQHINYTTNHYESPKQERATYQQGVASPFGQRVPGAGIKGKDLEESDRVILSKK